MSKKKQRWNDVKKSKAIQAVSGAVNKKGRVKGKNKRQTKTLQGMCTHHILNKKGKIKKRIINDNTGRVYCELCGHEFTTNFASPEELDSIVSNIVALNDQLKFINVEIGASPKSIDYASELGGLLAHFKKMYKRSVSVAQKKDSINKKKKGENADSATYGSWELKRH